jgi:putative membrane protein
VGKMMHFRWYNGIDRFFEENGYRYFEDGVNRGFDFFHPAMIPMLAFMAFMAFVVFVAIVVLVVLFVKKSNNRKYEANEFIQILNQKYINGEISDEEYLAKKKALREK